MKKVNSLFGNKEVWIKKKKLKTGLFKEQAKKSPIRLKFLRLKDTIKIVHSNN